MGKRNFYAHYGTKSGPEKLLRGYDYVLGPPDLTQTENIRKERSKDADEFWMLQAGRTTRYGAAGPLFPTPVRIREPKLRRTLVGCSEIAHQIRGEQLLAWSACWIKR